MKKNVHIFGNPGEIKKNSCNTRRNTNYLGEKKDGFKCKHYLRYKLLLISGVKGVMFLKTFG